MDETNYIKIFRDAEREANKILGLRNSEHLLCVDGMPPNASYQFMLQEKLARQLAYHNENDNNDDEDKLDYIDFKKKHIVPDTEEQKHLIRLIKDRALDLFEANATPRQLQVYTLYNDGYTQVEISVIMGCNQSSIAKSLNGNVDYQKGKRVYGGSWMKVKKLVDADPECQRLLKLLKETY